MIVASQMYTKLFRPWDISSENNRLCNEPEEKPLINSSDNKDFVINNIKSCDIKQNRRSHSAERANKLRKIRNRMLQQDATISTTTEEDSAISTTSGNELRSLEEINKRLGHVDSAAEATSNKKTNKIDGGKNDLLKISKDEKKCNISSTPISPVYSPYYPEQLSSPVEYLPYPNTFPSSVQRIPGEFMTQAELAQTLGINPNDPLLLESFAQGYAMEMEYARILHEENQAKILNAKKQRPKKYKCPHCDVGFSNNGQLKGHIRIHTGERPFKCDDKNCGKTFTRNEELTRHRRIHSGLRPYPCPTCGKKFGRRDHLKKHTKTHIAQAERMMPMFVPLSALPGQYPYLYGY